MSKKKILLKVSGEIFLDSEKKELFSGLAHSLALQIKKLQATHIFGIVVGGGNFFRGNQHGDALQLTSSVGHQVAMLGTMMNALMLNDYCAQVGMQSTVLSAIDCPMVGTPIAQRTIENALVCNTTIIFAGGLGAPFFTTDTAAIVRSLQMNAHTVWKGTHVDGIYTADPKTNPHAKKISNLNYLDALSHNLGVMDLTAYTMAQQHSMPIRVFDIFKPNALVQAAENPDFGSTLS